MAQSLIRLALQAIGAALVVSGTMWALQGLGILMWPARSFMLAQREWAIYGVIAVLIGAVMMIIAHRIKPRD